MRLTKKKEKSEKKNGLKYVWPEEEKKYCFARIKYLTIFLAQNKFS